MEAPRPASFGRGLRPLIWTTCDISKFSDSFEAVRGVGCVRNSKVGQTQQLCLAGELRQNVLNGISTWILETK